eukprot:1597332-Pleurochrysis_carterae.AAC.1
MDFVKELAEAAFAKLLQAQWNVELALYLKTELGISGADYLRLQLAMCKDYKDGKWLKRLWYQDAVT